MKELLLQQRNGNDLDASTDKANSPEAVAANETTNGILKLSQVLDNLFDERSPVSDELVQKDNQQASIEVPLTPIYQCVPRRPSIGLLTKSDPKQSVLEERRPLNTKPHPD